MRTYCRRDFRQPGSNLGPFPVWEHRVIQPEKSLNRLPLTGKPAMFLASVNCKNSAAGGTLGHSAYMMAPAKRYLKCGG